MSEVISAMKKQWKHWLVYSSCFFLSLFVLTEFALSMVFITAISPSNFMFYFTPAGLIMGESTGALFFTVLLFVGLLIVLRARVYVKEENSMKFNRENSYLLFPFYLTALTSLGAYIVLIPVDMGNLLTYAIFIVMAESFAEHYHVSRYGTKIKEYVPRILPGEEKEEVEEVEEEVEEVEEEEEEVVEKEAEDLLEEMEKAIEEKEEEEEKELEKEIDDELAEMMEDLESEEAAGSAAEEEKGEE